MKTLFQKELREHFKIGVIGFAIFSFLLAMTYWFDSRAFTQLATGEMSWQIDFAQPLISGQTLVWVCTFCAIFGALLGWLQIHSERHRDLWAFLVHRPISRTEIFFGKVMAGLCLYTAGTILPLLGFFIMVRMPGHFAAPFEWPMLLPILALFFAGTVFYFAGLLTGVRQARWYGSRGLGLAAAVIVMVTVPNIPTFGVALVVILIGAGLMATAACGSFNSHGFYEGQAALNQGALIGSLMLGCFAVVMLAAMLLLKSFEQWQSEGTSYQMARDGTIYQIITRTGHQTQIEELNGTPLKDKRTGHPITSGDFKALAAPDCSVPLNFNPNPTVAHAFFRNSDFFTLWRQTPDTLWYWERNGRLWAFSITSRRFIGSLGPEGFAPGVSFGRDRFLRREGPNIYGWFYGETYPARTLMTATTVYKLDLENRACDVLFESTNNEQIGGAVDYSVNGEDWDCTIIATKVSIRLFTPDGHCVWQIPFKPGLPTYNGIHVSFLEPTNQFAVWISPNGKNKRLDTHVVWIAGGEGILKSTNVPQNQMTLKRPWNDRVLYAAVPPAFYFIFPLLWANPHAYSTLPWTDIEISLAIAFFFMLIGVGMGLRHRFGAPSHVKWAIFHGLFGLPGLLAFICAQEWPARLPCPHCKRLRAVNREECEHCGAEFEAPARLGTEIFEEAAK